MIPERFSTCTNKEAWYDQEMKRDELQARRMRAIDVHQHGSHRRRFIRYYEPLTQLSKTDLEQTQQEIADTLVRLQTELLHRNANEFISLGSKQIGPEANDIVRLILYSKDNHPDFLLLTKDRYVPTSSFTSWEHLMMSFSIENYYQLGMVNANLPGERDTVDEDALSDEQQPLAEELEIIEMAQLRLKPSMAQLVYLQQHRLEFSTFLMNRCLAAEIRLLQQPLPIQQDETETEVSDRSSTR
jgi:hypothetical protein